MSRRLWLNGAMQPAVGMMPHKTSNFQRAGQAHGLVDVAFNDAWCGMQTDERLNDLLLLWDEHRQNGRAVTAEELCWNCPELVESLRQRMKDLDAMQDVLSDNSKDGAARRGPPLDQTPLPPPVIPGYQILHELGRGGMGVVYKARQQSTDRLVAIKSIPADRMTGAEDLARFRGEAEAVARLQHPNIVAIYDIGQVNDRPYFALECIEDGTLEEKLMGRNCDAATAAKVVATLADAIHYAHDRGIIHRDLKPSNVLLARCDPPAGIALGHVGKHYHLKITDFGLARRQDALRLTKTGAILGTPGFMAPEQARGQVDQIGPRTDVHGLGAILYILLTGRPPYYQRSHLETLRDVLKTEPLPPQSLEPTVPEALDIICLQCLEKDPRRRYANALDLADDLRRFLDKRPIVAQRPSLPRRLWRWFRRRPIPFILCG